MIFYMTEEDESEFLDQVRSTCDTIVLQSQSLTSQFAPIDNLPKPGQDETTRRFWLQNTSVNMPLITEFVEDGKYYVVDGFQSPVIEFIRSLMVSQILLPGRIQADMAFLDDREGDLVPKPVKFRKWFESIEGWIRRRYKHLTLLTYVGPGAAKFREEGGLLH